MTKSSTFLLAVCLLFWGWQSQLLFYALPMGTFIAIAPWITWRWHFKDKEFNRIADFCSFLWIITAIYLFSQQSIGGLFTLLNWLPIVFYPLILAQYYSTQQHLKLSCIFISLRKASTSSHRLSEKSVDFSYIFMLLCLLSSSTQKHAAYFIGILLLFFLALAIIRPRRYSLTLWLILVLSCGAGAFYLQQGVYTLQSHVDEWMLNWLSSWFKTEKDPYRQQTAIGSIGRLKQSDTILLRVKSPTPLLLKQQSYNRYLNQTWYTKTTTFQPLTMQAMETKASFSWQLSPPQASAQKTTIYQYTEQGKAVIAQPANTRDISSPYPINISYDEFNTLKIADSPPLMQYQINFSPTHPRAASYHPIDDLRIPKQEKALIHELANTLSLINRPPEQIVQQVAHYFAQNFSYTLTQARLSNKFKKNPLGYFLHHSRRGHCEYFATTTTLLLRAAGIPARYVAGYAANEVDFFDKDMFVVRALHAHAWTEYYLNGAWHNLDTTPSVWYQADEESSQTWWKPVSDALAWVHYKWLVWRWHTDDSTDNMPLLWLTLPLFALLIWRLYLRPRIQKKAERKNQRIDLLLPQQGCDSAFFKVIETLEAMGYQRPLGQTVFQWLTQLPLIFDKQQLISLYQQHQCYRFDPTQKNFKNKQAFIIACRRCVKNLHHLNTRDMK